MRALRILGVAVVVLFSAWMGQRFLNGPWIHSASDFAVFWRSMRGDPYILADMPFPYPPTGIFFFKPLLLLPHFAGLVVWIAVSLGAFVWAVSRAASWRVALLSLPSAAVISTVLLGQAAMLLGALIIGAFTVAPFWGGVMLAVAGAVKPQLLVFAPLALLVRRDWAMLRGLVIASAVLLSLTLFDLSLWGKWLEMLPHFQRLIFESPDLPRQVTPYGRYELWWLLVVGVTAGAAAIVTTAPKVEGPYLAGLIVAASLAATPYGHVHDLTALIPASVLLMLSGRPIPAILAAIVYVGFVPYIGAVLLISLALLAAHHARLPVPEKLGKSAA